MLPAMVVAANRWSADHWMESQGRKLGSLCLTCREKERERGRESEREERKRERENSRGCGCCPKQDAHIRNWISRLVLRGDFSPGRLSRASWRSERTNLRHCCATKGRGSGPTLGFYLLQNLSQSRVTIAVGVTEWM